MPLEKAMAPEPAAGNAGSLRCPEETGGTVRADSRSLPTPETKAKDYAFRAFHWWLKITPLDPTENVPSDRRWPRPELARSQDKEKCSSQHKEIPVL